MGRYIAQPLTPDSPAPSREDLLRLAEKYARLADLRQRRDADQHPAPAILRALSTEYPGCLRELDTLGLTELQRRSATAARHDAPPEPWMPWVLAYHRVLRAALIIKANRGKTNAARPHATLDAAALILQISAAVGLHVTADFVQAAAGPLGPRLNVLVLAVLAEQFGTRAAQIERVLFPARRPPALRGPEGGSKT